MSSSFKSGLKRARKGSPAVEPLSLQKQPGTSRLRTTSPIRDASTSAGGPPPTHGGSGGSGMNDGPDLPTGAAVASRRGRSRSMKGAGIETTDPPPAHGGSGSGVMHDGPDLSTGAAVAGRRGRSRSMKGAGIETTDPPPAHGGSGSGVMHDGPDLSTGAAVASRRGRSRSMKGAGIETTDPPPAHGGSGSGVMNDGQDLPTGAAVASRRGRSRSKKGAGIGTGDPPPAHSGSSSGVIDDGPDRPTGAVVPNVRGKSRSKKGTGVTASSSNMASSSSTGAATSSTQARRSSRKGADVVASSSNMASSSSTTIAGGDPPTKLHMVQSVHGDTLLLEFADGSEESGKRKFWMIDGGPGNQLSNNNFSTAAHSLFATMNAVLYENPDGTYRKVDELERLIVTHNHNDHTRGAMYLLVSLVARDVAASSSPKKTSAVTSSTSADVEIYKGTRKITAANLSWLAGYKSCRDQRFPIQSIWFNDKPNVLGYTQVEAKDSTALGWMGVALGMVEDVPVKPIPNVEFRQIHPQNHEKYIQLVAKSSDVVPDGPDNVAASSSSSKLKPKASSASSSSKSKTSKSKLSDVPHTPDHVTILGPRLQDIYGIKDVSGGRLHKWDGQPPKSKSKGTDSLKQKWGMTDYGKQDQDNCKKNASSIMFEFVNANGGSKTDTILFTGDSTGAILDTNYRDNNPPWWDIMKVMHHGSSRNNVLFHGGITVPDSIRQASVRFFRKYVATKYCISGDTTGPHPNPDILTLLGLLRARQHVMKKEFFIYITNGLTVQQYEKINRMQNMSNRPRIFVLKNEAVDYGTVTTYAPGASNRTSEPHVLDGEESNWMEIVSADQHLKYIRTALMAYHEVFKDTSDADLKEKLLTFPRNTKGSGKPWKLRPPNSRSSSRHKKPEATDNHATGVNDEEDDATAGIVVDGEHDEETEPSEGEDTPDADEEDTPLTDDAADDLLASNASSMTSSATATASKATGSKTAKIEDYDLDYDAESTDYTSMVYSIEEPFKLDLNIRKSIRNKKEESPEETSASSTTTVTKSPSKKNSSTKKKAAVATIDSAEYDFDAQSDAPSDTPPESPPDAEVATIDDAEDVSFPPVQVQPSPSPKAQPKPLASTKTLVTPTIGHGSQPIAAPPLPKPHQPTSWHQLMLSGLVSSDLDSMEDLMDSPVPEPEADLAEGKTIWVDVSNFISILISENRKPEIGVGSKPIKSEMIAMLKAWFCRPATGDSTKDTPILASMLLPILLGFQGAQRFFDVLPLNINGCKSDSHTLSMLDSWAPLLQMSVENFRARIYNPLPAERLECYAIYFELNIPHSDLSSMAPREILTWHVPFQNALWCHGQISFAHSGPLRVKIINPLYTNRVVFCHFDSQITVVRNFGVASGACHGTVISSPGEPAIYDVQVLPDGDGDFDVAWLCEVFAPQGLSKATMFDRLISQIGIPTLNAETFASKALGLQDVGVILRQSREGLKSVYIDDVYGTISIAHILSSRLLDIPKLLEVVGVPPFIAHDVVADLPDLTVTMNEIAFAKGHNLSFSLSKQIDGLGIAAIQFGQMAHCETRFDVWIVCEPDLALGDKANKPGLLTNLGFGHLLNDFEAARIFCSALSHIAVPFLRLSFTRKNMTDPSSGYHLAELAVVVEVSDLSFPTNSGTPIIQLRQLRLAIVHHGPTAEAPSDMTVNGSAFMTIDGCDVIAKFTVDQEAAAIDSFLAEQDVISVASDLQDTSHDTGGFLGDIDIELSFPDRTPTIGAIVSHIVGDISSAGLDNIKKNIPSSLLSVFGCTSFRNVCVTVTKSGKGENWRISNFSACFDLEALAGNLNIFGSTITFEMPILNVVITNPTLSTRSYEISIKGAMVVSACVCDISAVFIDPSSGGGDTSCLNVSISGSTDARGGIPIGELITFFTKKTAEFFGLDNMIPAVIKHVASDVGGIVDAFSVNDIMVTFKDTSTSTGKTTWNLLWVECMIQVDKNWTLFPGFEIGQIVLHMSHNTGAGTIEPAENSSTLIVFHSILTLRGDAYDVSVTHDGQQKSTCVEIDAEGKGLDLISLMEHCIDSTKWFTVPPSVSKEISNIVNVKADTFYLSYMAEIKADEHTKARNETITISVTGSISIFSIKMSAVSIICEKQPAGTWNYTLDVALQSPCNPFTAFIAFPGLDGILVGDGHFSYFNKSLSKLVNKGIAPASCKENMLMFSGKLKFEGNSILKLISGIIKVSEIDMFVTQNEFEVAIPAGPPGSAGLIIFDTFFVHSFTLEVVNEAFGLGADVELRAPWLCDEGSIRVQFDLLVGEDGSIGADFKLIGEITNPLKIPGVTITDAKFSLIWLLEAEEPRSLSGAFGLKFNHGQAAMTDKFEFMFDEEMPSNNYFKMDIEELTLGNVMAVLVGKDLPVVASVFGESFFGFKSLVIDFAPFGDSGHLFVKADVFLFGIEGKIDAHIMLNKGLTFAGNLSVVDVLGIIKIHAYKESSKGPFVYLDTQATDLLSGGSTAPDWMHVNSNDTTSDKMLLSKEIFALTAEVSFLGATSGVYGVLNASDGLKFIMQEGTGLSTGAASISFGETFSLSINGSHLSAETQYNFSFVLNLPSINIMGIKIGSYSGTAVSLMDDMTVVVSYGAGDWKSDGLEYKVHVKVDLFGLSIDASLDLDLSITNLEQLPAKIESFVEDKVIQFLEDKVASVFEAGFKAAEQLADEAAAALSAGFNAAADDIMHAMSEAGHALEDIASALKNTINLTINEVATTFVNFGHDVGDIASALGNTFDSTANDVASALSSAGVTVEHAFEAAWGDGGAELTKDFSMVGNSVAAFGVDAEHAIVSVISDARGLVKDVVSDVGQVLEAPVKKLESVVAHICVVI